MCSRAKRQKWSTTTFPTCSLLARHSFFCLLWAASCQTRSANALHSGPASALRASSFGCCSPSPRLSDGCVAVIRSEPESPELSSWAADSYISLLAARSPRLSPAVNLDIALGILGFAYPRWRHRRNDRHHWRVFAAVRFVCFCCWWWTCS